MAVLRQLNILSQMRVDVPHLRSLESSIAADFDTVVGRSTAGGAALVVRGFELANTGGAATAITMTVADGIAYNLNASESGTFLWVPSDRAAEVLNPISNSNVTGSWTPGTVNYVGLDFVRTADATTTDLVQFLDANTLLETPREIPTAKTLDYQIVIGTLPFSSQTNLVPVAIVTLDMGSVVTTVADARPLLFRLGTGGDAPDYQHGYSWPLGRGNESAFTTGDRGIRSQKDWQDAVMTRLWELGGGENWYSPTADRNVKMIRTPGSVFSSTGENFEVVSSNLHWQGLKFLFDNANDIGVYYNSVQDQTTDSSGLTNLAIGECLYVNLSRSGATNATVIPVKATIQALSSPTVPGSRFIIAWRASDGNFYTRDSAFPVGTGYTAATVTNLGSLRVSRRYSDGVAAALSTSNSDPVAISDRGGVIVANAANNHGLNVTGNGTGSGAIFLAGATGAAGIESTGTTSYAGVEGFGGPTDGSGVEGYGGGSNGPGVQGVGGSGDANGVEGFGTGDGYGVQGLGATAVAPTGTNGGSGVVGVAISSPARGVWGKSTGSADGVLGQSTSTGTGVRGIGGGGTGVGTGAYGGQFFGGTGYAGLYAKGDGTSEGAQIDGGATGDGVLGNAGASGNGSGGVFQGAGTGAGVIGLGGATNGRGGDFTASGTASGIFAISGTSAGSPSGVYGRGKGALSYGVTGDIDASVTNGVGVRGIGKGTGMGVVGLGNGASLPTLDGQGVVGVGGSSDKDGVRGIGGTTDGNGVYGVGTGAGSGVVGVAGSSAGSFGVQGVAGAGTASAGVSGDGSTNSTYGVIASGDTTSPARAAFRIVPQNADPTVGQIGDLYVTTAGVLKICTNATGPVWTVVGTQT